MLTMINPLTIEGYTVYHDDSNEIDALNARIANPAHRSAAPAQAVRFLVLPKEPSIALDAQGKPIFSLIVYRRDEQRIDPNRALTDDVGGGILTFTVELTVPDDAMRRIKSELRTKVYGDSSVDPTSDVELTLVEFLDGKVSVAVAGETGSGTGDSEFVKTEVGTGKVTGIGSSRKAVMVKLTQAGAALMSSLDKLRTLPINVQYELSFEHRLLGVSMRVWCDIESSYKLVQETLHTTPEYSDGYLNMSHHHVDVDKITSITELLTRSKTAGVEVIPETSQIDSDTLASLEKLGFDMLNNEMQKALQAAPPPAEIDRTYLQSVVMQYGNNFNFRLDRRMVLVKNFTPSANISNVIAGAGDAIAFVDLRTGFFSLLKVPVRVNADFAKMPLDSVIVTIAYQSRRPDGTQEQKVDSFSFTDGAKIQTFIAFANSLANVAYDWSATVHYKGTTETYTFNRHGVKDTALTVDVGTLGMIAVDLGLGLVDLDKFPQAQVSLRYHSQALERTFAKDFLLTKDNPSAYWTEAIHEEPTNGYEYKVDWLRKSDLKIIEGVWTPSTEQQLRVRAPIPDHMSVKVVCSGKFGADADAIVEVPVSLRYSDPTNHYTQEGSLVFNQDNQQQDWSIDLVDPQLRAYQYRYSIVYKGGVVKNFPEDGGWFAGEPGFITVGEKYALSVDIYPTLQTYPDHAKLVEVDLTYNNAARNIHVNDSFVFTKEDNQRKVWRVRGPEGVATQYVVQYKYFSANGDIIALPAATDDRKVLIVPAAPAVSAVH